MGKVILKGEVGQFSLGILKGEDGEKKFGRRALAGQVGEMKSGRKSFVRFGPGKMDEEKLGKRIWVRDVVWTSGRRSWTGDVEQKKLDRRSWVKEVGQVKFGRITCGDGNHVRTLI